MSTPLEDYALLSDTQTAALVSRAGSIDWLCLPRFDAQATFSALLGGEQDGHWLLDIADGVVTERRYLGDTFVLETVWRSPTGRAKVTDFMPINPAGEGEHEHTVTDLIRMVECLEGEVDVRNVLRLRFDYGASDPYVRHHNVEGIEELRAIAGPNSVHVRGPRLEHHPETGCHTAVHTLRTGDAVRWVLTWSPSHFEHPPMPDHSDALEHTRKFWREWIDRLDAEGEYLEPVRRSLLVLRALTHSATGAIVGAPTTSLPEEFGGVRNWDYRYTWLRDSAMAIEVLVENDFKERAVEWRDWLLRAIAGDADRLRIMYGLGGERHLPEFELGHLAGYEDSTPVRIGNGAAEQYQSEVVGEVMVALKRLRDSGVEDGEFSWELQKAILDFQEAQFDVKDQGIWEMRGEPHHFTQGRAMMWAAFDRGVQAVEQHGLDGPVEHWRDLRERLREEILTRGFNEELNSFTQAYDNTEVDASLLMLAQIGFVDYDDPRMLGTVERIERELLDDAGFLYRYRAGSGSDGLPGEEYPFLMCSFWLVEQYAHSGRLEDAREMMDRILSVRTDLGLLSEEYSSRHQRLVGNFPQTFSHLALVRAAYAIKHPKESQY
ncbi:glycoside hydrolase family 15 protein [Corynebacterium halotolerans]|uniref:glycoside hydrolase family 15 protein n=1 Tax=Corynebacterium halotolerans TaxID=225326 RepID=UPI000348DE66|nr:glycoside hydrolase family 15 protein [Corynebacterium halotolerans]